ncbi:MAG: hypothetical protein ACTSVZ_04750 [Promethearchaeota archaeon]
MNQKEQEERRKMREERRKMRDEAFKKESLKTREERNKKISEESLKKDREWIPTGDVLIDDTVKIHGKWLNGKIEDLTDIDSKLHWKYYQDGTFVFEFTTPSFHDTFKGKLHHLSQTPPLKTYVIPTIRGIVRIMVERNEKATIGYTRFFKTGSRRYIGILDPSKLTKIKAFESVNASRSFSLPDRSYLPATDEELIQKLNRTVDERKVKMFQQFKSQMVEMAQQNIRRIEQYGQKKIEEINNSPGTEQDKIEELDKLEKKLIKLKKEVKRQSEQILNHSGKDTVADFLVKKFS